MDDAVLQTYWDDIKQKQMARPKWYWRIGNDYTAKEMERMNGEMKEYNLDRILSWKEYKQMPDDLRKEYLDKLAARGGNINRIAKLMGISYTPLYNDAKNLQFEIRKDTKESKAYVEHKAAWEAWVKSQTLTTNSAKPATTMETMNTLPQEATQNDKCNDKRSDELKMSDAEVLMNCYRSEIAYLRGLVDKLVAR